MKSQKKKSKKTRKTKKNIRTKINTNPIITEIKCSPKTQDTKKDYTCLENETLHKLKVLWNKKHPDLEIISNDSKEIWEALNKYLNKECGNESCWLKQKFVKGKLNKELKTLFAPMSPKEWIKKPKDWLSSTDILDVMKQYEKTYKCFKFIGPTPIDFDKKQKYGECVWDEFCHFSLKKQIKDKKFKIGMIFNTDPHDKGGSHWISMFVNIKKNTIFFFDSAGDKIPKEIMKLVNRIIKQGKELDEPITFKFDQNHPVEHQYGESECGIYALYFIVHLLEDKHMEEYFKTHVITDKYITQFRKIYFNTWEESPKYI